MLQWEDYSSKRYVGETEYAARARNRLLGRPMGLELECQSIKAGETHERRS